MLEKQIGHYTIIAKLGEGGMGVVYLAEDLELRRKVALKLLSPHYTSNPDAKARFKREAQAAAALTQPNIVTIYEVGEHGNQSYIAMEYVEGESLADLMSRQRLTVEESIAIVIQLCQGLSKAHRAGIVHRDLKPANILIDKDGQVKIVDFGLARISDVSKLTLDGKVMGTPNYMSPEQVKGETSDRRSDIFSVGIILYELLTGECPFRGDQQLAVLYAIAHEAPLPLAHYLQNISGELQSIIDKALQKDLASRYQNIDELLNDLQRELPPDHQTLHRTGQPAISGRSRFLQPARSGGFTRRYGRLMILALLGIAVVIPAAFFVPDYFKPAQQQASATMEAMLTITTTPVGATVFLDGDSAGVTPLRFPSAANGKVALRLLMQNYATIDTLITLNNGLDSTFSFSLNPLVNNSIEQQSALASVQKPASPIVSASIGTLRIISDPQGAEIFINGSTAGTTPYSNQNMKAGEYKITLRKKGYDEYSTSVSVSHRQVSEVNAKLAALMGRLSIQVKPFGSIIIDGTLRQEDSDVQSIIELQAGVHKVKAQHPTFGIWEKSITVESGQVADVVVDFNKYASLTVIALDESGGGLTAEILVDGHSTIYATPKLLKLRHGTHSIEVRRQGYQPEQQTINLENDVDEPMQFILKKTE